MSDIYNNLGHYFFVVEDTTVFGYRELLYIWENAETEQMFADVKEQIETIAKQYTRGLRDYDDFVSGLQDVKNDLHSTADSYTASYLNMLDSNINIHPVI